MTGSEARRRTGGRSARVRRSVLDAALEIIVEEGAEGLSVNGLAMRSGVHETSIYRRWGSRENVIVDALLSASQEFLAIPDTGSLQEDLSAFVRSLGSYLKTPLGIALLRMFASDGANPELNAGREQFWQARSALASQMIQRAAERNEVSASTDPQLVLEALVGPVYFRVLLTTEEIDDEFIAGLVDMLLDGLTP
jgi:AcrR family transcriptional regulator